ncbi:helix-turn-helix domain-containing protein [Bacillus sp. Hm123]|uniref:helix-turn-helix domain-containing protein n=1 Tax=Bacillus sp. Hm123 TaxID=3450745 RepID=UPI003F44184E
MNFQQHMYAVDDVEVSGENTIIQQDQAIIIYVAEGEVEAIVDRRTFHLMSDSLLVIQARNQIHINVLHGEYTLVRFQNYHLVKQGSQLIYEVDPLRFIHEFICYGGVTHAVVAALAALQKSNTIYNFQTLLLQINNVYEGYERHAKQHTFEDIVQYVKKYAHHNLTRDLVAKRFGYNANYFSESFKKEVGWGFNEFLSHIRLEKAKLLLLSSSQTIQEVARNVGYRDSLYLSRKFSQQVGLAPSKFRDPTRLNHIVTLQFTGALLATGIKPTAVLSAYYNLPDVIRPHVESAVSLSDDWLREEVTWNDKKPDLIIASVHEYPNKSYIRNLEKIAPVVALEWDTYDRLEEVRMIGKLVGREAQAEAWIKQYEQKIKEAKYVLKSVLHPKTTVGVYELRNHGRIGIWRSNSRGAYNIYEMLKLQPNAYIEKEVLLPDRAKLIEESELPLYAADEMFVVVHCKEQEHRFFNQVWQSLPAMKRQKVHMLRLEDFWSSEGVALEEQLTIQMDYLLGKRKSDIYL